MKRYDDPTGTGWRGQSITTSPRPAPASPRPSQPVDAGATGGSGGPSEAAVAPRPADKPQPVPASAPKNRIGFWLGNSNPPGVLLPQLRTNPGEYYDRWFAHNVQPCVDDGLEVFIIIDVLECRNSGPVMRWQIGLDENAPIRRALTERLPRWSKVATITYYTGWLTNPISAAPGFGPPTNSQQRDRLIDEWRWLIEAGATMVACDASSPANVRVDWTILRERAMARIPVGLNAMLMEWAVVDAENVPNHYHKRFPQVVKFGPRRTRPTDTLGLQDMMHDCRVAGCIDKWRHMRLHILLDGTEWPLLSSYPTNGTRAAALARDAAIIRQHRAEIGPQCVWYASLPGHAEVIRRSFLP